MSEILSLLTQRSLLIIFTYAPAGLGHLRVTDALYHGLPVQTHSILFHSQDSSISYLHHLTSIQPTATGIHTEIGKIGKALTSPDLCHFDEAEKQTLAQSVNQIAGEGLRVLGMAKAYFEYTQLPTEQHDFNFKFLGLAGLADLIRPTVPCSP